MPFTTANGLKLYYERAGDGPPLLFISGTGGVLRNKPNVFDGPLAKRFDLLAYDQRGLGQSQKPDLPYSMADYADDAAALMATQGWDEAAVIGVSFGGMVAQELAIRHPERVKRLVLACTSPGGAGGASFPFHEIEHLKGEARGRHMIPISDTRRDEAWAAANPDQYALFVAMGAADPYADEPGHATGAHRQLEARARMTPGTGCRASPARPWSRRAASMASRSRPRRRRWRRVFRARSCSGSKAATCSSSRTARPRRPWPIS